MLKATPTITWATPADITYGTALSATQLNATAQRAGHVRLHAGRRDGAQRRREPDAVGDVHADRRGELHDGDRDGDDQRAEGDAGRSPGRRPADITYGTALSATQLNATASVPGTLRLHAGAGTVLNAGAGQTLSVTFTPTDAANYTTATTTVTINVLKATPIITWATPADITYGTALSATQLNATANVAGTFVYTPPAGTVLTGGCGAGPVGDVHADGRHRFLAGHEDHDDRRDQRRADDRADWQPDDGNRDAGSPPVDGVRPARESGPVLRRPGCRTACRSMPSTR